MALDSRASLELFLDTIWKIPEGHTDKLFVYLPSLRRDTGEMKKSFLEWPRMREYVVDFILAKSAMEMDVYISPVLYNKPSLQDREAVLGSWAVWVDFDGNAPTTWSENLNDHATGEQAAAPGPPSIRIQSSSSGHEHCYWLLEEFATNTEWLENANRSLAYGLHADASGWDYSQLLRPPSTTNYGKTDKRLPVTLASFDDLFYSSDSFRNLRPVAKLINEEISETDPLQESDYLGKYSWDSDQLNLYNKSRSDLSSDRSSAMMRLAFYGAELGMTELEIFSMLWHLDEKWLKFKERRDRKKRLLDMVNKAKLRHPHKLEPVTFEGLLHDKLPDEEDLVEHDPRIVFHFKEFLSSEYRIEWMIDRLVARKSIGLIASAPGKGKTQFMMGLGMHAAVGKSFVGYNILKPHKILFMSLEMGPELLSSFLRSMSKAYSEDEHDMLDNNFLLLPAGQQMSLHPATGKDRVAKGREFLVQMIEEWKPDAIFIDSLARVLPGKFTDEDVIELFAFLSVVRRKYGVYIFVVHHNRKAQGDNKRPKALEDIYGSQYIGGEVDWAITLFPEAEENVLEVNEVKNRFAMPRPSFHIKRVENLQFELHTGGSVTFAGLQESTPAPPLEKRNGIFKLS